MTARRLQALDVPGGVQPADVRLRDRMRWLLLDLSAKQDGEATSRRLRALTPAQVRAFHEATDWAKRLRLVRFGPPHMRLTKLGRLYRWWQKGGW